MELRDSRPQAVVAGTARAALLAGPTVLAFFSGGFYEDPRLAAAIAAWALLAVLAVTAPAPLFPRSPAILLALGGLAALLGWAALSRTWAPLAGPAGEDVQRDALYLASLAGAIIALRPRRWARSVEPAVALGTLVVAGYGLSGRLLPGLIDQGQSLSAAGRLDQPLTYWNAEGALTAIGLLLCARLAGDRTRPDVIRVLAPAAAVVLSVAVYLTYSRGALGALGAGLLVLLLLAPTWPQLRAAALCLQAGAVATIAASRLDGVASLTGGANHREAQGVLMLSILVAVMISAAAVQAWGCRVEADGTAATGPIPLPRAARRAAWVATVALALFPYAAATREKGAGAARNGAFGATAQRFGSVGTHRYAYWRVAAHTFAEHPLKGTGAASFRVQWLRERPFREPVRDAHSLYIETAAELGLVGLLALAAMLSGVALGARRAWLDDPAPATGALAGLTVFAVHAGVDWDWEMPALTLTALLLAGLVLAAPSPAAPATPIAPPIPR